MTVDELLRMVRVALENARVDLCLAGDQDGDGTIIITEIVAAVTNALNGCGME